MKTITFLRSIFSGKQAAEPHDPILEARHAAALDEIRELTEQLADAEFESKEIKTIVDLDGIEADVWAKRAHEAEEVVAMMARLSDASVYDEALRTRIYAAQSRHNAMLAMRNQIAGKTVQQLLGQG